MSPEYFCSDCKFRISADSIPEAAGLADVHHQDQGQTLEELGENLTLGGLLALFPERRPETLLYMWNNNLLSNLCKKGGYIDF